MRQVGVILKGEGLNHQEYVELAHLEGKRTKDCGFYIEVGLGEYEPLTRPLYEGFGERARCKP